MVALEVTKEGVMAEVGVVAMAEAVATAGEGAVMGGSGPRMPATIVERRDIGK